MSHISPSRFVSYKNCHFCKLLERLTDRHGNTLPPLRKGVATMSGPSLPVPVELVSGDVFIVAPEYVDAPEC